MANKTGAQLDQEIDEVLLMRQRKQAAATAQQASNNADYERRELADTQKRLQDLRRSPLADRKEAQEAFLKTLREDPALIGERIAWLLNGSYGYGPMQMAKRSLNSKLSNRPAALTQMIAAFEWMTPEDMARAAWKKLSASEQLKLERVVRKVIDDAESEE